MFVVSVILMYMLKNVLSLLAILSVPDVIRSGLVSWLRSAKAIVRAPGNACLSVKLRLPLPSLMKTFPPKENTVS